jgi:hypothetical protein
MGRVDRVLLHQPVIDRVLRQHSIDFNGAAKLVTARYMNRLVKEANEIR